jgi:hypothetical protein
MMAGCAYGQLTVGTNDIWRLKKGDIVVTNVTLDAGKITGIPHETNETAHASLFAMANTQRRVYSPTSTNIWIDGDGNKYTSFDVRTVTFSEDFTDYSGGKPSEISYQLTYGVEVSAGPYNNYWKLLWNSQGVNITRRVMYTYNHWLATTNPLVLESSDGGMGVAFVTEPSTVTNLLETLTGKLPLTGGKLSGILEFTYPYGITAVDALGNPWTLTLNGEPILTTIDIATKLDISHTNDPVAHTELFATKVSNGQTNITLGLASGSTASRPLEANQVATKAYVDSLIPASVLYYVGTNTIVTADGQTSFLYQTTPPPAGSRTYSGVTNNQYLGSCIVTNLTGFSSPMHISSFQRISSTSGKSLSVKCETYYSIDGGATWLGDWTSESRAMTAITSQYDYTVSGVPYNGACIIKRMFKVTSVTGNPAPDFILSYGTNTTSSIDFDQPGAAAPDLSAYTTASQVTNITRNVEGWLTYSNLTGSVTLTNQFEAPIALESGRRTV